METRHESRQTRTLLLSFVCKRGASRFVRAWRRLSKSKLEQFARELYEIRLCELRHREIMRRVHSTGSAKAELISSALHVAGANEMRCLMGEKESRPSPLSWRTVAAQRSVAGELARTRLDLDNLPPFLLIK